MSATSPSSSRGLARCGKAASVWITARQQRVGATRPHPIQAWGPHASQTGFSLGLSLSLLLEASSSSLSSPPPFPPTRRSEAKHKQKDHAVLHPNGIHGGLTIPRSPPLAARPNATNHAPAPAPSSLPAPPLPRSRQPPPPRSHAGPRPPLPVEAPRRRHR